MINVSTVSIIIPCYNQGLFIDECLQSIFEQSYINYEIIVVNDGSTDLFTNQKLGAINDARVKVLWTINQGLSEARNTGIKSATGTYILPLDADDRIAHDYILKAIDIFEKQPDVGIVYGKAEYFGEKQGIWEMEHFSMEKMLFYNQIYASAIFRKSDFEKTKGYDPGMLSGWEDWDFWLSILELKKTVYFIDDICFYYRIKTGSMIRKMTDTNRVYLRRRIYDRHSDLYKHLFSDPLSLYEELQYFKSEFVTNLGGKVYRKLKEMFVRQ